MNASNQCGATKQQCNIPEQEQAIARAVAALETTIEALESKVASARAQISAACEKDPNLKQPEPIMSLLALALKNKADSIFALTNRLQGMIQTLEL